MTTQSIDERVTQLEKVVATQSEMILKLVEMMNHLGNESTATNERLNAVKIATSQQFDDLGTLLQRLVGGFNQLPPTTPN